MLTASAKRRMQLAAYTVIYEQLDGAGSAFSQRCNDDGAGRVCSQARMFIASQRC